MSEFNESNISELNQVSPTDDFLKAVDTYTPISNTVLNKEDIQKNVETWVVDNLGKSFEFREYQLETIVDILYNILEDKHHNQIIEAPTGSGKSLLNIISAGVLADCYDRESYILCSDLYLWDQYYKFIQKTPALKRKFGVIKGQTGNYTCAVNHEDMRNADCRMAGISWGKLFSLSSAADLGYSCAAKCQYVKERKKAIMSKVVLMTYQLYLYQINIVNKNNPGTAAFKPKDTIFCDECHNIPGIVEKNCEPCIVKSDFDKWYQIYDYASRSNYNLFNEDDTIKTLISKYSIISLEEKLNDVFGIMSNEYSSSQELFEAINRYHEILMDFNDVVSNIEGMLAQKKQVHHSHFTKEDIKLYKLTSFYRNYLCIYHDFITAINDCGAEYLIREVEESKQEDKHLIVTLKCAKEDYMSWIYLLRNAHNRVMMSATIGGFDAFTDNVGIHYTEDDEAEYTVIPSTFDFTKSPIHYLNRYKMSYKEKDNSFKALKPMIYSLCAKQFKGKKGMIQTGSYANAKEIYDSAPPEIQQRMLMYNGSKEKTSIITFHQMSEDTILIGPTLVEGIDLPGDDCRFIVILKVPYPVITDRYVKKKIELFPLWYNSTTSNTIIQGIGRGNRFKDDWCVTYILDACFLSLYNNTKDQYPVELQQRIKIYN